MVHIYVVGRHEYERTIASNSEAYTVYKTLKYSHSTLKSLYFQVLPLSLTDGGELSIIASLQGVENIKVKYLQIISTLAHMSTTFS